MDFEEFEELCSNPKTTPLDPEMTIVEFLEHNSKVFSDILKTKGDIYKEILNILLEKEEKNLKEFIKWYRDLLYEY